MLANLGIIKGDNVVSRRILRDLHPDNNVDITSNLDNVGIALNDTNAIFRDG